MRSKCLAELYGQLACRPSFNRPHVSNDNPYSESHFKTLKYHPDYPERFGSIEDARNHMRIFFQWYNTEHRHSGIAMMTPESVHYGRDKQIRENVSSFWPPLIGSTPNGSSGVDLKPRVFPRKSGSINRISSRYVCHFH